MTHNETSDNSEGTSTTTYDSQNEREEDTSETTTHNTSDTTVFNDNKAFSKNSTDTKTLNTNDEKTINGETVTEEDTTDRKNLNTTDTKTHNTADTTSYGKNVNNEMTSLNHANGTSTDTGTESTVTRLSGADGERSNGSGNSVENANNEVNKQGDFKSSHKGRTESVADIVPRAIAAIVNHNELMWFRDAMCVCFDCTSYL